MQDTCPEWRFRTLWAVSGREYDGFWECQVLGYATLSEGPGEPGVQGLAGASLSRGAIGRWRPTADNPGRGGTIERDYEDAESP